MKSFVAIFLLCYFSLAALMPRMDFDRLYQIPDLVGQFLEYEESDADLDFISLRCGNDQKPADGPDLPFQGHDCCISCHTFASFLPDMAGNIASVFPPLKLLDFYSFHFTSKHTSDIWQPPRA